MSRRIESTQVNIGCGGRVMSTKVAAVLSPESVPMCRLKDDAMERIPQHGATEERKNRSITMTDSDHAVLSVAQVETLTQRFTGGEGA